jgi:uncharacterized protein YndB with AHSA1/START domain
LPNRSVTHASFVIERHYPAKVERVFYALADPAAKRKWFAGPAEWGRSKFEMDFRVGGREINAGGPEGGPIHTFNAIYQDIVPNERIIYSYDMHLDEMRISVSLATIELKPEKDGTLLVFTEQGAFLDGYDDAGSRERGTRDLLEALGASLDG